MIKKVDVRPLSDDERTAARRGAYTMFVTTDGTRSIDLLRRSGNIVAFRPSSDNKTCRVV